MSKENLTTTHPRQLTRGELLEAIDSNNIIALKEHFAAGGDPNAFIFDKRILHIAIEVGHEEIIEVFLAQSGVDIESVDHFGKTSFDLAIEAFADSSAEEKDHRLKISTLLFEAGEKLKYAREHNDKII